MEKLNMNTIVIKLKEAIINPEGNPKIVFGLFLCVALVLGMVSYKLQFSGDQDKMVRKSEPHRSMDTFVPDGKTLLQIKIANYESLDQIIGQFGVVDLYTTPLNPDERPRRLAYAVKIVKAPGNPRIFNVLLADHEISPIVGYQGEYTVAIRNPKKLGTKVVKPKPSKPKRRIVYEWENL